MIGILRAEFLKIRTIRAVWVLGGFIVAIPMLVVMLTPSPTGELLLNSAIPSILLMGVIGVMCSTQEYSQGTIRITLAAVPRRARVFVAKVAVAVAVAVVLSVVLLLMAHVTQMGETSWDLLEHPRNISAYVLVACMTSVIGVVLGLLLRSSPGAITAIILWPTLLENIVAALLGLAFDIDLLSRNSLPFQAGFVAITRDMGVEPGTEPVVVGASWGAGLGTLAAFMAALAILSFASFSRRDA